MDNNFPCPICSDNFKFCPHSLSELEKRKAAKITEQVKADEYKSKAFIKAVERIIENKLREMLRENLEKCNERVLGDSPQPCQPTMNLLVDQRTGKV